MKQFVWDINGNYANGKIIAIDSSIDNCLKRLKEKEFSLWQDIQSGFSCYIYLQALKEFVLSKIDDDLMKKEISSYRDSVINNKKNGNVCIEFHKNATDFDILKFNPYHFLFLFINEFIEQNLIDNKTPWFVEPQIYDIENILHFSCID